MSPAVPLPGADPTGPSDGGPVGGSPEATAHDPEPHDGESNTRVPDSRTDTDSRSSGDPASSAGRGLPGGRVVTVATLLVVLVALLEVTLTSKIATWTCLTLVAVAAVAALVTRPGDRSLPIIMPPLAFLTAAVCAGQGLVEGSGWSSQSIMLVDVLGSNASWVVAATAVAALVVGLRRLIGR